MTFSLRAQQLPDGVNASTIIQNTTLSGEYFLGFSYNDVTELSKFDLKRGYFTLKTRLNDMLSVRYTQDITLDREGDDAGNVEMRLKYLYLAVDLEEIGLIRNSSIEFGLVHRPWVDFEQKINGYRVQGPMFTDHYDISTSADFGIMVEGLIGGVLTGDKTDYLASGYRGRYGSYAIGLFNGGGYHSIEQNNNKVVESRLTLRPLPDIAPGIQISWALAVGKTNLPENQGDYLMNLFFLSSEHRLLRFTAQYYRGTGSYDGSLTDISGTSYNNDGYSLFAEIPVPQTPLSLFSRYDSFNSHQLTLLQSRSLIGGITYRFFGNKVLFNYQHDSLNGITENIWEIALEISF
ncbi:MAG: hypothetical protein LC649_03470 [Bacteroidales bacterium]|nr:hypothetical protein [Bacteroidales bacterium]